MSTRLERILDTVRPCETEVTLDVSECSPAHREAILAVAALRGLHVSGTSRWLLIRDLRAACLMGAS